MDRALGAMRKMALSSYGAQSPNLAVHGRQERDMDKAYKQLALRERKKIEEGLTRTA